MYAIIESGGKQYRVEPGNIINVEKINSEPSSKIDFDKVLTINNDGEVDFGAPFIRGAKVRGEVVELKKDKKLTVFKMKRRKAYRRKLGHRQLQSVVKILGIDKG